jgi:anti-sigma factor RsiW
MNHATEDQLLLLAYGELPEPHAREIESHIAACTACADQLAQLERGRAALDVALPPRRSSARAWIALAAAAVVAGLVVARPGAPPARGPTERWTPTTTWSATAGYVAGGKAMVDIDAQLTRLEQELPYARP